MRQAARQVGISIEERSIAIASGTETIFTNAMVSGEPTEDDLENGVDVMFAFISLPPDQGGTDVPPGFYGIRFFGSFDSTDGVVDLINQRGETVVTLDAILHVTPSLVPVLPLAGAAIGSEEKDVHGIITKKPIRGWKNCGFLRRHRCHWDVLM